jgi:predicted nucleotidyltransferase
MGLFQASTQEVFGWASRRIEAVLGALHERLRQLYGERFRGLYVFGSYARPDAGIELPEDSDLDVALILSDYRNAYDELKRFGEITYDLELEHSLVISIVPVREADFKEGRTNFARVISSYAIPAKK